MLGHLVGARLLEPRAQINAAQVLGGYRRDPVSQQRRQGPAETTICRRPVGRGRQHLEAKRPLEIAHPGLRRAETSQSRVTGIDKHSQTVHLAGRGVVRLHDQVRQMDRSVGGRRDLCVPRQQVVSVPDMLAMPDIGNEELRPISRRALVSGSDRVLRILHSGINEQAVAVYCRNAGAALAIGHHRMKVLRRPRQKIQTLQRLALRPDHQYTPLAHPSTCPPSRVLCPLPASSRTPPRSNWGNPPSCAKKFSRAPTLLLCHLSFCSVVAAARSLALARPLVVGYPSPALQGKRVAGSGNHG